MSEEERLAIQAASDEHGITDPVLARELEEWARAYDLDMARSGGRDLHQGSTQTAHT